MLVYKIRRHINLTIKIKFNQNITNLTKTRLCNFFNKVLYTTRSQQKQHQHTNFTIQKQHQHILNSTSRPNYYVLGKYCDVPVTQIN